MALKIRRDHAHAHFRAVVTHRKLSVDTGPEDVITV